MTHSTGSMFFKHRGLLVSTLIGLLAVCVQAYGAEVTRAPIRSWSNTCNVPGDYKTGQGVCDARRILVNWATPLTFEPDGENGICKYGPMAHQYLAFPYNGMYCPKGFGAQNITEITQCGGTDTDHLPHFKGPNATCFRIGPDEGKNAGPCPGGCVGDDPVNPGTGNKFQTEPDYSGTGPSPLKFERTYNSRGSDSAAKVVSPTSFVTNESPVGAKWTHNYNLGVSVESTSAISTATVSRPDGKSYFFSSTGGAWSADSDISDRLERLTDAGGVLTGWRFTTKSDQVELYDAGGKLLSITSRSGISQTMAYSDAATLPAIAPAAGLLIAVTDSFGRQLNFTYDSLSRINTMTDPAGQMYRYAYDAKYNLTSVAYPDATPANTTDNPTRVYHYESSSLINALTGITDESNIRFSTYGYDSSNRATLSQRAGGVGKVTLAYGANTTVTDAVNTVRTFGFSTALGAVRNTSISLPCVTGCSGSAAKGYDANNNVSSTTDFNGRQTTFVFDLARNLETSRTEAFGTPRARTITTQWHPTYRTPTQIDEPGRRTTSTHDANGNVLTNTVLDTALSTSRTTTYTYNTFGQVLTIDGPRTDANDVTTYTYYNCTTGYECGQVQTITNALNQTTTYNTYNAQGQPLTITDANGVVTTITYDERQRLKSRTAAGETTTMFYYPTGLVQQVVMPDNSFLNYTYDAAHRLTEISDSEGNKTVYTLDAMGNRTAENVYDPSNALTRTRTRVFDSLSRLYQDLSASGSVAQTTTFGYDANGNQTTIAAPMGRNATNAYDELNRLKQVTDANNGVTQFGYNALDQLISVTDPRNLQTTYGYNALGDMTTQVSPDTGTTTNTYDSGGNLKTTTDARNKTATYTYDALNRVTQVMYPDQTLNYTYDVAANGVGKISSVSDSSGQTSWTYTAQGRIATKTQTMGSMSLTVMYGYNAIGQLTTVTTPSSKLITYGYTNNRVTSMMVNSVNLLSNVLYEPFGPTSGWTWGNGTLTARTFDTDGKLTQLDSAGFSTVG